MENNDRFLRIALYQGDRSSKKVRKIPAAAANVNESKEPLTDPTLLCCAFKKHRIYLFRCHSSLFRSTDDVTINCIHCFSCKHASGSTIRNLGVKFIGSSEFG